MTKVHDSAPLRPDVLKGMRDSFAEFLRKSEDMEVTEMILGLVTNSVGLEGVETEQCREPQPAALFRRPSHQRRAYMCVPCVCV